LTRIPKIGTDDLPVGSVAVLSLRWEHCGSAPIKYRSLSSPAPAVYAEFIEPVRAQRRRRSLQGRKWVMKLPAMIFALVLTGTAMPSAFAQVPDSTLSVEGGKIQGVAADVAGNNPLQSDPVRRAADRR
jgi:hypothetical protein